MRKILILAALIALVVSATTIGAFSVFQQQEDKTIKVEHISHNPASQAAMKLGGENGKSPLDFTAVAEQVMDAVVHIKSTQTNANTGRRYRGGQQNTPFRDFFDDDSFQFFFNPRSMPGQPAPDRRQPPKMSIGQGSGVVISEDGYIVTNRHVIADADDLEVTLHDNRSYKASVVGMDPTTDLAVIRIKEKDLTALPFVDSDQVKVGEWVLAIGNPFNLTSTVTAGIVSAKGRNINILREQFAVESFIQTDAAINPGNSGGALVNLSGGLIGINTAIASPTGAYSGYGFAVPTNIVSKVVSDLMEYGVVQRGVLGVMIRTVSGDLKRGKELSVNRGVLVDSLLENSAAGQAGIKAGDVIIAIDELAIHNSPELQEMIARHRPGDELTIKVNRDGREKSFSVTLNNRRGDTGVMKKESKDLAAILGVSFEDLDTKTARLLELKGGVRIKTLFDGKLQRDTDVREGFIITKVDGKRVTSIEELLAALEGKKGGVMLEGVYENLPGEFYYAFGM